MNLRNKLLHYPLPTCGLHILHFLLGIQCSQGAVRYLSRRDLTIKILSIPGEGYLAYGTSDGSVGLVKISQTLLEEDGFSFVPKYNIKVDLVHYRSQMVYESQNLAGITALRWIKIVGRNVYSDSIIATEINTHLIL